MDTRVCHPVYTGLRFWILNHVDTSDKADLNFDNGDGLQTSIFGLLFKSNEGLAKPVQAFAWTNHVDTPAYKASKPIGRPASAENQRRFRRQEISPSCSFSTTVLIPDHAHLQG